MNASSAAAKLPEAKRKKLALRSLSGSESVTQLSEQHGVSRKFVYDQVHKARSALDDAFGAAANDAEPVLVDLKITPAVLRQMVLGLTLICRSSYRGRGSKTALFG